MQSLFEKEFRDIQYSATGWLFAAVFAIVPGLFLWLFPGNYNLPDSGYADLSSLFELASILLLVLLPALTMKVYSEEKKSGTWDLLRSRPVSLRSVFACKFFSVWIFTIICIATTLVSVACIWYLGFPKGNLDEGQVAVSYGSLILLSAVYTTTGLFSSSLTRNAVAAFIIAIVLNFSVFYGFKILAGVFSSGSWQVAISGVGLSDHVDDIRRGILELNSILLFILYFCLFAFLTISLPAFRNPSKRKRTVLIGIILLVPILGNGFFPHLAKDCTSDRRYTLSDYSLNLLDKVKNSDKTFAVNVFLEGELNSGFVRLRQQINFLLKDINQQSNYHFQVNYINPLNDGASSQEVYRKMGQRGMKGIMLNDADRNGKVSRQLIYPYLEVIQGKDSLRVNILKNIPGNTAEDNLKASAENLEFEFMDILRMFLDNTPRNIAFIEGHNELPRPYLLDVEDALSKYFSVNRGQIGLDANSLNPFRVVVIAGPTKKYSEQEKYILDQYIMHGGRVLWLLDGIYFSEEQLSTQGRSVTVANQTGLDDLLFSYGIRVNPILLQDEQSASLLVNSESADNPQSAIIPWYFCPLLLPSPDNPITKDIALVKAPYVSGLDLIRQPSVQPRTLLTTSEKTHVLKATEEVNFDVEGIREKNNYFNQKFVVAAASMEGKFTSAYLNRLRPDSIENQTGSPLNQSTYTKMIVAASSGIIRNEIAGEGEQSQVVPLGLDRISGKQFGNKDFIINAVNWLANDDERMVLRQKQQKLRLLNKVEVFKARNTYVAINLIVPILVLGSYLLGVNIRRKRKYGKRGN